MADFWNRSWSTIDSARIEDYVDKMNMSPDYIIEFLKENYFQTVCDAGCGCGAYSLKLARNGLRVFGFDVSPTAVEIAKRVLSSSEYTDVDFKTASIISTGYPDNTFDAVISRDVIDHIPFAIGIAAIKELYRITKPNGKIIFTLDALDEEYEHEPHRVNLDGDYEFTGGKWEGMAFHPYTSDELGRLVQVGTFRQVSLEDGGLLVIVAK